MKDVLLSKQLGTDCIEIHTGRFANLVKSKKKIHQEFLRIKKSSKLAYDIGIEVHAGHGLDYRSTKILTKIEEIKEFNIGHFIIGESIFLALRKLLENLRRLLNNEDFRYRCRYY